MDLVENEEIIWRQRSKCLWLKKGDRNTKYFHAMASSRRRNNLILKVRDERNIWQMQEERIVAVFLEYFNSIFTTSTPTEMKYIFEKVEGRITEDMNGMLMKEFTKEEVRSTLDQMHPDKARGLME